jgi:V/A-type H+/Na+-transporting ATPase subunit I
VLTLLAAVLLVKAPTNLRPIAMLVLVIGLSTAVAGILLNGAFGHTIFGGPGIPQGSAFLPSGAQTFSPLGTVDTEKGRMFPMMSFALVIGIVQIFVGMILKAINQVLQGSIAGAIQPLASLFMVLFTIMLAANAQVMNLHTLAVGPLHIGPLLTILSPTALTWLLVLTLALFFLFNNLQMKIFLRPFIGLWEFYQFVGGIVGNVLSYIRLFALGLAGGLLGAAFNYIAFMFIMKDGQIHYGSPLIVATILLLTIGHTINLGLSMIGSFVHPLRLTFVEFYGNLGFKGSAKPYAPFRQVKTIGTSQ